MANFIGTTGADILDANTSGADLVSGGAGNDTLAYEFGKAGGADRYYGGTHTDVLELRFTQAEWDGLSSATKTSITTMKSAIAAAAKTNGAVAAGTKFGTLDFGGGKTVTVYEVESLKIMIDGVESDGTTPAPNSPVVVTTSTVAGNVAEDGTLKATGTINFTDANLADVHSVSVVDSTGATSLGSLVLGAVSESATTAAGAVGWTFNLDNAAAQSLAKDQVETVVYTVEITDNKGSTVTQAITIKITGAYDAPVIEATTEGAVVEAGAGTAGVPEATGKMPLDGVASNAVWAVYKDIADDGTDYTEGYDWGDFSVSTSGVWTFKLNQKFADKLTEGQEQSLVFGVTATENGQASVLRKVTIVVTGSDDGTTISVDNGSDLTVTEANGPNNDTSDDPGASGKLNAVDPDDFVEFQAGSIKGAYGDVTIDTAGNWSYALRNGDTAVQALKADQVVTDTITVKATDGTTFALKITITGADDQASMSIVDTLTTLVDEEGYLVDANGKQILDKDDNPQRVTVVADGADAAEDQYDNLVHEAPGKDHAGKDDFVTSGKISLIDPDGGALLFHPLDEEARSDEDFADSIAQGIYGRFTLNTATGEWTYTLDNSLETTQGLTGAETLEETYDRVVIWSADGKSSQEIRVHVKGADDGWAQIVVDPAAEWDGLASEVGDVDPKDGELDFTMVDDEKVLTAYPEASGKLTAVDPDTEGADASAAFKPITDKALQYGKFSIAADGSWTYLANTEADTDDTKDTNNDGIKDNDADVKTIYNLGKDQVVTETVVVQTVDGQASYAISIRLTGHNSEAELSDVTTNAAGKRVNTDGSLVKADTQVMEAGGVNNAIAGDKEAKGIIKFVDADTGESAFATGTATTKAGTYGAFKLNTSTGAWSYTLDDAKANALRANEVFEEKWELVSKDGSKGTLVVNVIGADDATAITAVAGGDYTTKEAGGVNNAVKGDSTAGGTLLISDPDGSDENSEASFADKFVAMGAQGDVVAGVAKAVDEVALTTQIDSASSEVADGANRIWGDYGFFTFNTDTNKWTYTLVDAEITDVAESTAVALRTNQLVAGQKAMDVLRVYSSNMAESFDIKVNITGANDTAVITNTITKDMSLQAQGYATVNTGTVAKPVWTDVELAADENTNTGGTPTTLPGYDVETAGTLAISDPDGGSAGGFGAKAVANAVWNADDAVYVYTGTYGKFTFALPEKTTDDAVTDVAWTYALSPLDKDTRALTYGQKAVEKVNITATDGSVYTIVVNVTGANDAPALMQTAAGVDIPPKVNSNGTITYQVIDGDVGGKLTLQIVQTKDAAGNDLDTPIVRDVPAMTVVDGGVSTIKLATTNSTVLHQGTLQVTDNVATDKIGDHPSLDLQTFLGIGTKGGDTIISDSAVGSLVSGMDGNDNITTADGTDYVAGGNGNDTITSGAGKDTLLGGAGDDVIEKTGEGNSLLQGDAGKDSITAGDGNDTIMGGADADMIVGGAGDDRILGDAGADNLTGGDGNDTFVFLASTDFVKAAVAGDVITDFESGADKILLGKGLLPTSFYALTDVLKADGVTAGTDGIYETIKLVKPLNGALAKSETIEWFRSDLTMKTTMVNGVETQTGLVDSASGTLKSDDRLIYDANSGILWYDADGVGTTAAVKIVQLDGAPALTATDIQFG